MTGVQTCALPISAGFGADPHRAHQRLDAIEAAGVAVLRAQNAVDAWRTIAATLCLKDAADARAQGIALVVAR